MSKIALLDTAICPEPLHCKSFQSFTICGREHDRKPSEVSHGTVCARVLDQFAVEYDLISIQILPDTRDATERPAGPIRHLKEGLSLCLQLDVEIICLSSVSSVLSDSKYLFSVTQELAQKSIIVSALDNRRYMTVPTSYPFVVGVQSDLGNYLSPGELACHKEDVLSAEVFANCNIDLLRKLHCAPSNSFAVPVAAAKINNWINEKKDAKECLRSLSTYPVSGDTETFGIQKPVIRQDIPIVAVYGSDEKDTYAACKRVMDRLYEKYSVQTSALCSMEYAYDIRFRRTGNVEYIRKDLAFMKTHYKTDLIFVIIKKNETTGVLAQIDADVKIMVHGNRANILFEDESAEGSVSRIADLLIQILQ